MHAARAPEAAAVFLTRSITGRTGCGILAAMAEVLDDEAAARRAGALLGRLASLGVHAADRIAVLSGNGAGFVAARDAATAAELVLVPINPRLAPAEIAWIVGHARPRVL